MAADPTIRDFRHGDLEEILEIERASFDTPFGFEVFRRVLSQPNIFLVAELEGHVAGYILAVPEGEVLHVISVAVAPQWRRRGLGRKLFETLFEKARRIGKRGVILEVDAHNTAAQQLYYSLGFSVSGRVSRYYENGHDALLMSRQI